MSLEQSIDHGARRIYSRAEGEISADDMRYHFERESAEGALAYPEFVDGRAATPRWSSADVRSIVDLLSTYALEGPLGPTAVLVQGDFACGMLRMLGMLAEPFCAIRPFRAREEAEAWLIGWSTAMASDDRPRPVRAEAALASRANK